MNNEKLVRKVLRTLPKRFAHKVTTIEEAQNLTTMRLDELIENFTTFEMTFEPTETGKKKGISLKANCEGEEGGDLAETAGGSNGGGNRQNRSRGIQYKKCEGFGHIQVECPNYVKKQSKSYYTTLSDEDIDEDEGGDHNETNFVAFTAQIQTSITFNAPINNRDIDPTSDDEGELTEEELVANYQMLFDKGSELTQAYT
ncbi:hypothetical protein LIER_41605 [Lithospermum erythrorhizon]|uniref:Gag-pol polyprotein n=1 Tax=Lithospermum erythrorhizon TaxID=34254 RepID=A0AAV3RDC8_LITER